MKDQVEVKDLEIEELEERIAPDGAPGQLGFEGHPGNQGNGVRGSEGHPGNEGNGVRGFEGHPGVDHHHP